MTTTTETREAAIREAKRYIRDIVRNDWCFEPSTSTTGPRFQTAWPIAERDVKDWRPRDYDDSCSELEPRSDDEPEPESEVEPSSSSSGAEERRRKRRKAMEEEMRWNEGLRTWMERRDAWSGARSRREIQEREERLRDGVGAGGAIAGDNIATGAGDATDVEGSALATKTEESLTIANQEDKEQQQQPPTESNVTESDPLPEEDSTAHPHHHDHDPSPSPYSVADESYIPIVPSILSETNPIRASITPSMYPSIYSKVIVQSLTPTVPINLADVTKAMVQGWKADGQWPPKPANTNIVLQDDATVRKKDDGEKHETKKKGGVASAVRKVLHFSGFHPHHHPFHRRGSSHGSGHHHEHQPGSPGPSNEGR